MARLPGTFMTCPGVSILVSNLAAARQKVLLEEDGFGANEAKIKFEVATADLIQHLAECPMCKAEVL